MYKITKVVINSSNTIIKKQVIAYAELDTEHLPNVIGALHNLVVVENKRYEITGSGFRIKYIISQHKIADYKTVHDIIVDSINETIINTNDYISRANVAIKRSNRRNNRKLDNDLLKPINPKDYFFINDYSVKVDENSNYIID